VDQAKYRKLFLEEARAHLTALDGEIAQFGESPEPKQLDSLFRHAHSIKGMAASMGYEPIVELSHALEDLMSRYRDGSLAMSADSVSILLAAADALSTLVDAVDREEPLRPAPDVIARLNGLMAGASAPAPASSMPDEESDIPESGVATVAQAPHALTIHVSSLAPLPAARAFQAAKMLESIAASFEPAIDAIRAGKFQGTLKVSLLQPPSEALLQQLRAVPDVEKVEESAQAASPVSQSSSVKQKLEVPSQVRVNTAVLDRFVDMVGELVTVNNQIRETSRSLFSEELQASVDALARITGDLYQQVLQARMVPFSLLSERLPRIVREVAQQLQKEVKLSLQGNEVELDRSVMENLSDPLLHLVRNAIDHGLESPEKRQAAGKPAAGSLTIRASQAESQIQIVIEDDGNGIDTEKVKARAVSKGLISQDAANALSDAEAYDLLFRPGFSTADQVSNISGRGVGLDVVKTSIETLGGEIQIASRAGAGTTFVLRLPARVAIIPVFLVRAGEQTFGLPIAKVSRARWLSRDDVQQIGGRDAILHDSRVVPFFNLARLLGIQESFEDSSELTVFEIERGSQQAFVGIDAFLEEREVYLKAAPRPLDRLRGLLGITLVRGEPVFVLDPGMMVWNYA
jgi:two-component system chemotaxis sensor kinase CheA